MQHRRPLLVSLVAAIALGSTPVAAQVATPVPAGIELPAPTGSDAVGRTSFDWVDAARAETFTEDPSDQRELVVWVWYPAAPGSEAEPAAYLPGQWGELIGPMLGFDPTRIQPHAAAEAPLAPGQATYPVLIFSPGSGFFIAAYTALAEELASHGYIVVGVNHTYNAGLTVFADGRVAAALPSAAPVPAEIDPAAPSGDAITAVHAADLRFILDRLERLEEEPGLFQDRLDLSRLGILGHSLGGAAAAEACRVDRRCDAGVNMDGRFWGQAAESGAPVPFLLMMADHPPCAGQPTPAPITVEQCQAMDARFNAGWDAVRRAAEPGYWLVVEGSAHGSFSDVPFLPLAPAITDPLLAGMTIEPEPMWRLTSDYLLAFFDESLNGNPAPLLDGPSPNYPAVRFLDDEP